MKTYTLKLAIFLLLSTLVFSGCSEDSTEDSTGTDDTNYPIVSNETYISTNGLEWQSASYPYTGTWQEAIDYCETLSWAGYTDWRLPALENIYIDYENFSPFRSGIYWSTTESTIDSAYALALWGGENEAAQDASFLKADSQSAYCVRGSLDTYYTQNPSIQGRWAYVASGDVVIINDNTYLTFKEKIDDNHITITDENNDTLHLIRAGIADVKLKGEIATVSGSGTLSISRGVSSIGSLDLILKNAAQDQERRVSVVSTTDDTIIGTITPATATSNEILYVADPATTNDRVLIPENSELTMPTGDTQITVLEADNNATFNVSVVGEETDMGILTVTDQTYNFKSYIENGNDWRYFGYNDGEDAISYEKILKICNIGTTDISGVSFVISLDSNASDINRTFLTDYDGSAVPFTSGECKEYTASFSFTRPLEDRDVKINIVIKNNFNALIWNDYASLKVSQYPHHNLYFNSNTKTLNGILITPGRNLINVEFSDWAADNYVRVPLVQTDEYNVIISTPNIADEDVYMISSGKEPDTTKMDGFTAVLTNEPDNNTSAATQIALFKGETVAYLHKGDIDFYKIVDKPLVINKIAHAYIDFNISIIMNTEMNTSSISTDSITLTDSSNTNISGIVSYNDARRTIIFTPDTNLTSGTYTVSINSSVKSATNYTLASDTNWNITISDYPSTISLIDEKTSYYSSYEAEPLDYISSWVISNDYIYMKRTGNLAIFDIRDPASIEQIAFKNINDGITSEGKGLKVIDDIIYADDSYQSFNIFNASNLNSISRVSHSDLSTLLDYVTDIDVSGNYAYIIGFGGLKDFAVFDISNISAPVLVADASSIGGQIIRVEGDYAYIGYGTTLKVIDISDKNNIEEITSKDFNNIILDIKIVDNYIYLAIEDNGLAIVEILTPFSLATRSTVYTTADTYAVQVAISGNYAFLTDGIDGLRVIDITDKNSPTIEDTYSNGGDIQKVLVNGNFAYIHNATLNSIQAINIQMYK